MKLRRLTGRAEYADFLTVFLAVTLLPLQAGKVTSAAPDRTIGN